MTTKYPAARDDTGGEYAFLRAAAEGVLRKRWHKQQPKKKPEESCEIFRFPIGAISYQISGGFDQTGICVRTLLANIGKLFILITFKPFRDITFRMIYFPERVSGEQA